MRSKSTQQAAKADGIVLDTGASHVCIACVPTHGAPHSWAMPNAIARTRPGVRRQVLVADQIETACMDYGGLQLRLPIDRGFVVDWAAQKNVWDRAIAVALGMKDAPAYDSFGAFENRIVIVTEPYFALPEQQRAFDALMFEWYQADAIWRTIPAQLAPFAELGEKQRPEAVLVVDCGHSYTHAAPIVHDRVQWSAVRRLDVGGKVLTSLLKMMFSFRQWNMMEETYLTDKMKDTSCFVAARAYDSEPRPVQDTAPHDWSFAQLVELFHEDPENGVLQQYVLPDYARPEDVADHKTKYGYVVSGPGALHATVPSTDVEEVMLDNFICADTQQRQPIGAEHQVLRLGQERCQVMETLFAPQRIGLTQGSLAELIADAIQNTPEEVQPALWANILLMGGTANAKGLRRRLAHELRMLAPDDVPVSVHIARDPVSAPVHGAASLLQAAPNSAAGRFLASHLMTRDAWYSAGGSSVVPGERAGTKLSDARFDGWNAGMV
ncbi:Actin- protein 6 [Malassezia vespertilionis]|uniref:Arp6p n=1 Tax=Malassezia vespertilionis TaxID=2020962 RepID=A0A2N1J8T2_9BASI|nr:Actin- protein 6 [Malassezia vespertilionis]PKI82958.1 Arp6p [Malassezia vespertilionis]WFD08202.1 Actin- protein 6 [Malassezia vespertilionis]